MLLTTKADIVLSQHPQEEYAAQIARMGNLQQTILDQSRWEQPEMPQLHFQEEVRKGVG